MGADIIAVYRRAGDFARAVLLIVALPIAVEMARHALMSPGSNPRAIVLAFTLLSTATMLFVLVTALRWWRFEGDWARIRMLRWRVLWGIVAMMAIQLADEMLFTAAGHMLANLAGHDRAAFVWGAQLMWLLVSVPLFPWYVAMMSDDPLTLAEAIRRMRPCWLYGFGVILGALAPVLALAGLVRGLHPVVGDIAEQVGIALANGIMIAATMLVTDAAYFGVYRIARAEDDASAAR
ncbi:hypothetical protein [Sphingomonas sp. Root710]|uniref:hypothetical protein n=1 Tax=Sphingomonas sp. Root710 TaxID=1736594 RepID=UPI0012E3F3CB|nr:hypothetical protein [Sphingomonas sp. Root710]